MTNTQSLGTTHFFWSMGLVLMLGLILFGGRLIYGGTNRSHNSAVGTNAQGSTSVPTQPISAHSTFTPRARQNQMPDQSTTDTNGEQRVAANDSVQNSGAQPSTAKTDLPIICIDPGHPSEVNRGTTVQNGLTEVEIVYDVALKLKSKLEDPDDPIARVVMTRNFRGGKGQIVTNRERAEIANKAGAALLVRLHCDTGKGSGFTIYYPDRVGKAPDGKVGPSQHVISESRKAATAFHDGMLEVLRDSPTKIPDNGVKGDSATYIGRKHGALTGSVYSEVPALTVEMVYLSNPYDSKVIGSKDGQQLMADSLTFGIMRVLETFGHRK